MDKPGLLEKPVWCYEPRAPFVRRQIWPLEHPRALGRTRVAKKPVGRSAWVFHVLAIKSQKLHALMDFPYLHGFSTFPQLAFPIGRAPQCSWVFVRPKKKRPGQMFGSSQAGAVHKKKKPAIARNLKVGL